MSGSKSECHVDVDVAPPVKKFKQSVLQFGNLESSRDKQGESSTHHTVTAAWVPTNTTEISCSSECCKDRLTPNQPNEPSVLNLLQREQEKWVRRFSPSWYSQYPWLTVCTTRLKVFCIYCRYCSINELFINKIYKTCRCLGVLKHPQILKLLQFKTHFDHKCKYM